MNTRSTFVIVLMLLVCLGATVVLAKSNQHNGAVTLKGVITDALCGAQHIMEGGSASCARACVGRGSRLAFVTGDKVYTLEIDDQKKLDRFALLAGETITITGTIENNTIRVISVNRK